MQGEGVQEAACLLGGGFKRDRRAHVLWLLAGVMGESWQSCVIIYRFLEERGGGSAEDCKPYFKGTKQDKNSSIPLLSSSPPAASINHVLIFPACLKGLSAWAPEPSLWHPSDLPLFHVSARSNFNISE